MRKSFSTSAGVSADVGSSRMSSCRSVMIARAISTNWDSATDSPAVSDARIEGHAELVEGGLRPRVNLLAVERAEAADRRIAHGDVLGDVEMREELRVLVDGGEPGPARLDRRMKAHLLAAEEDLAPVGADDPGDDLDQRRLAGAVLADQRMDPAPGDLERHIGQGLRRAVGLGYPFDPESRRGRRIGHGATPSSACRRRRNRSSRRCRSPCRSRGTRRNARVPRACRSA